MERISFALRLYRVFRAPWIFLASWTGLGLFWGSFFLLHLVADNYAEAIVDFAFRPILTLIWGSYENTIQMKTLALCTQIYFPIIPGLLLKLIEFVTGLGKHFKTEQQKALEI